MSKFHAIVVVVCIFTFVLFGTMCYLMTTVNPPPLPEISEEIKSDQLLDEIMFAPLDLQRTDNKTKSSRRDYETENSVQKVVPPIRPTNTKLPIKKTVGSAEKRVLNKTRKDGAESTTSTINDTLSVIKRSLIDGKQLVGDLNPIVLKIIDDSGLFNIEIKIDLNDAIVKKKNDTREDKIQSKEKSKYSLSLKTKDNDQFKKTKLAKNTIIRVMPNEFVTDVDYDDHVEAKNKIKNNMIQASIVDFNNMINNITENKATVMPIYRDVFKPIVIFYNQTKSIYPSDKKTTKNEQRVLLAKSNDTCKTKYNVTTQTEKGTEKGDLLENPNNVSDGCKTNLNSFETANNAAYNVTIQTEKTTTTRNENTTVEAENSSSSTETLDETSTTAEEVNSTIPLANGNSIQNDTRDLIEMNKLVQSQNRTKI